MKVASWNVNSLRVRLPQVLQWLDAVRPDMLAIQETKLQDELFPVDALREAGWQVQYAGQKTYNGVALVSRSEATDVIRDIPGLDDPQRRILGATIDGVRLINLYVPNGESVDSVKYAYKLDWLAKMAAFLEAELARYPRLAVVGDFNVAPADIDVHDPDAWRDKVLCSEPERAALQRIVDLGLRDTFRTCHPERVAYSWWDYRTRGFSRDRGLRIDLVLASEALCAGLDDAAIDREPRGWERPSDHAPVFADFDL